MASADFEKTTEGKNEALKTEKKTQRERDACNWHKSVASIPIKTNSKMGYGVVCAFILPSGEAYSTTTGSSIKNGSLNFIERTTQIDKPQNMYFRWANGKIIHDAYQKLLGTSTHPNSFCKCVKELCKAGAVYLVYEPSHGDLRIFMHAAKQPTNKVERLLNQYIRRCAASSSLNGVLVKYVWTNSPKKPIK